ncbi:WGR domain-containing protein [Frigidibacter mobilis]|uniref:WGR domain-containing protein n=1 Tax=Frigidibacter mobilis TaxID=1335048 RepID=A0A159Z7H0_9RHOB|nr:WGR domain-containing protein [Frigidibacter mobilis]AMY71385.1 WGR domain-containing protein [Frigidibacter mobilis]
MIDILLHRRRKHLRARFVRVEIVGNLFGEYSLLRETGAAGRNGRTRISWYANLREACLAADLLRIRAQRQGYRLTRASPALRPQV